MYLLSKDILIHLPQRLQDLPLLVQRRADGFHSHCPACLTERYQFGGCQHVLPRYAYRVEHISDVRLMGAR